MGESAGTETSRPLGAERASWVIAALSAVSVGAVLWILTVHEPLASAERGGFMPALNAGLNASAAIFLVAGFLLIRRGQEVAHRRCMLIAFALSSAFFVGYLTHHARVGSVPFEGVGWIRSVYFLVLIPHIVLATAVVPLALFAIHRGWTDQRARHRQIVRWTLPIWLYVSVSGVLVYAMQYHLLP